jgi:hypothetical protein
MPKGKIKPVGVIYQYETSSNGTKEEDEQKEMRY